MKKRSFDRLFCAALVFHAALALAAAGGAIAGRFSIRADFFDIVPEDARAPGAPARRAIALDASRRVVILASAADFETARAAAGGVYTRLADISAVHNLSLYIDPGAIAELTDFMHEYRYQLLDGETIRLLENGNARAVADAALERAYSFFAAQGVDTLESDPFLLSEAAFQRHLRTLLAAGGELALRGDVLAAKRGGLWYVMLSASVDGASAVPALYAAIDGARARYAGASLYYSGAAFHAYESSRNAEREITLISAASLALVIILFLAAFRSLSPLALALAASALSVASAACGALCVMGGLHLLALVFGATLLGCCVDYAVHYFIALCGSGGDTAAARRRVIRPATICFASTEVCFAALLFAPFPVLRQFAVFSLFGMASAYLSVAGFLPRVPLRVTSYIPKKNISKNVTFALRAALAALVLVMLAVVVSRRGALRFENGLGGLYKPPPELLRNERAVSTVLGYTRSPLFFIVSGNGAEEVLRTEERLSAALAPFEEDGRLGAYLCASRWTPSEETQRRSYRAAAALAPLADAQYRALGLSSGESGAARFAAGYESKRDTLLGPGGGYIKNEHAGKAPAGESGAPPAVLRRTLSGLFLGGIDGRVYSCVMLVDSRLSPGELRELAAPFGNVSLAHTQSDVARTLDGLTRVTARLLLCAYILILIIIKLNYAWRETLKIACTPLAVTLGMLSVSALSGGGIGFFTLCAFVLAFGLGLDYMFYTTAAARRPGAPALSAAALSFCTSAVSFGALSFSSFVPARIFGSTVLCGLGVAFLAALALRRPS